MVSIFNLKKNKYIYIYILKKKVISRPVPKPKKNGIGSRRWPTPLTQPGDEDDERMQIRLVYAEVKVILCYPKTVRCDLTCSGFPLCVPAVIGLLYPCIDSHLGEPHKFKREWASVMRCIAVFVGINHASVVSFHPETQWRLPKWTVHVSRTKRFGIGLELCSYMYSIAAKSLAQRYIWHYTTVVQNNPYIKHLLTWFT